MNSSIKILFIGGLFYDKNKEIAEVLSKGAVQNAANKLQWNYVKGIENNLSMKLDLLNAVYIGTFPKYHSKILIKGKGECIDSGNRTVFDVGFINVPVLAEKTKYLNFKKEIKKWINNNKGSNLYIMAYGMFEQNLKALRFAKHFAKVTTCLIVPDLPQYMNLKGSASKLKQLFLDHVDRVYNNCKTDIDYYSVITEQMGRYLKIPCNRYVVIDGMVDDSFENSNISAENSTSDGVFSFLYTGGLSSSYGTDILLSEFLEMENKNTELWICGDGPYADEIKKASKNNKRIRYFGVISQNECISLQHMASCLINPREDSDITAFSFPSKTMEYLLSGKPVIAKKLSGMGEEYAEVFFQFDSSNRLRDVMNKVSRMDISMLKEFGLKGKTFVSANKNNRYQTLKMIKMLSINEVE